MKCVRVIGLAMFTAFVFGFILSEDSYAIPREDFYDDHGRCIGSVLPNGRVVEYPVSPRPAKRPAPKPVVRKPAPKQKAPTYKPFDTKGLVKKVVVGGTSTATAAAIPAIPTGGLGVLPAAAGGAASGAIYHVCEWGYDNMEYGAHKAASGVKAVAKEYKRISVLEDPMGKSFPH